MPAPSPAPPKMFPAPLPAAATISEPARDNPGLPTTSPTPLQAAAPMPRSAPHTSAPPPTTPEPPRDSSVPSVSPATPRDIPALILHRCPIPDNPLDTPTLSVLTTPRHYPALPWTDLSELSSSGVSTPQSSPGLWGIPIRPLILIQSVTNKLLRGNPPLCWHSNVIGNSGT